MLGNIELFQGLSENDVKTLQMFCQERVIKKWEILFQQWDEATSFYVVKSWKLEALNHGQLLWVVKAGEIVWEMALFAEPKARSATIRAVEDTHVIVLLEFSIKELTQKHPDLLKAIQTVIAHRNQQNKKIL